ncbi:unnamed protein product [Gongylonema pulchrum]|uniref:G_PROTEIN_RECEP_F3_4 domain-containing protein n=1 Tax=Gongylonema pulchrum TaxID=637853 RepID=A0A183DBG1_9BILA|nr:unnamed protein product [Gongylonema pulchrum]
MEVNMIIIFVGQAFTAYESASTPSQGIFSKIVAATEERPWLWAVYVLGILVPVIIIAIVCFGRRSSSAAPDYKKTDEPQPDDDVPDLVGDDDESAEHSSHEPDAVDVNMSNMQEKRTSSQSPARRIHRDGVRPVYRMQQKKKLVTHQVMTLARAVMTMNTVRLKLGAYAKGGKTRNSLCSKRAKPSVLQIYFVMAIGLLITLFSFPAVPPVPSSPPLPLSLYSRPPPSCGFCCFFLQNAFLYYSFFCFWLWHVVPHISLVQVCSNNES